MTKPVIKQVTQDDYKEALKIIKLYKLQKKQNWIDMFYIKM